MRLQELREQLAWPATSPSTFSFEHPVDVVRGRGQPPYTDLMIYAPSSCIAIEAKYTEPPYEIVETWLRQPWDTNRSDVLQGWLELVERATGARLTIENVLRLPYQLIHRAASACFLPATYRAVVYQIFDTTHHGYYVEQFYALRRRIGDASFRLAVLASSAEPSRNYAGLLQRWDRGERKMAHDVRRALLDTQSFAFSTPAVVFI